jgi:hypothetical protein
VLVAFAAGAWLMDRRLKRDRIAKPFPSIGARAMLVAFIATVAAFALLLWIYTVPTHQL